MPIDGMFRIAALPLNSGFSSSFQLSIGRFHTCGMRSDRSVWCVGQNTMGQIGVTGPQEIVDWTRVF